ncbi:hypothetical protein G5714_021285 [Onychostoma macrolepis]|uniref:Secreted protein n=1 Tax=Onychostoma macrolepis TaxID=369639 RepID=A0A7J6BQL0_9TELE|nr:hypothetical protein G5714_021285 [Onychostoma macrolepis]
MFYLLFFCCLCFCHLVVGICFIYWKHRKTDQEVVGADQTHNEEITYADTTFYKQKAQKSGIKQEEEVVYAGVVTRS